MTNKVTILILLIFFYSCTSTHKNKNDQKDKQSDDSFSVVAEPFIPELDNSILEISGLTYFDSLFWGFNDSGGKPELYGFDLSGEIKKVIRIKNGGNEDWESIAQDEDYIYIGDFGNNLGARKNLNILKIDKSEITQHTNSEVDAQIIGFNYTEQQTFNYQNRSTPFDCEAMIESGNNLYIFTKNWEKGTTSTYKIPKQAGNYSIAVRDTFNVEGLITGADLSSDKKTLALLGYENYHAFIWLFTEFDDDDFFAGKSRCIRLPNLDNAQTEGICFWNQDSLLISCENAKMINQQVFLVDLNKLENGAL